MFPRLVQLVLETRWIRDGKPDQIFFLLCSLSALCRNLCSLSSGCAPLCVFFSDFVTVTLSLRFGDVTVTARDFTFYDCTAVKQLSGSQP